jgi:hypothetical protein
MSSVLARTKQIPADSQYFIAIGPLSAGGTLPLLVLNNDAAASTTSYVSGALAGNFTTSNVAVAATDSSGTLNIFRDMGQTLMSSGRTFRAVQLLKLDGNKTTGYGGYAWTSAGTTTAGVWQPSNEGVMGSASAANVGGDYGVFFFETGARGLGIAQGLVRYG